MVQQHENQANENHATWSWQHENDETKTAKKTQQRVNRKAKLSMQTFATLVRQMNVKML